MSESMTVNPLGTEKISSLLVRFALPSIVAMLVSSLYNMVDQIFIGWGIGYLGNAATTVAFPLTTICLAIALLIGVGSAAGVSLSLGEGNQTRASKIAGSAIMAMIVFGLIYLAAGQILLPWILPLFGGTSENMPLAMEYSRIILIGMPFLIVTNGLSNLIRADGSPTYSMTCMLVGAAINLVLDPTFIFLFGWGMAGAAWATIIGQIVSFAVAFAYLKRFKTIPDVASEIRWNWPLLKKVMELGLSSSLNQVSILIVQLVINNSLVHYGSLSAYGADIPIAACGIVMKLNGLYIAFMVGLSQGSQPIIGFNYGARKYARVRRTLEISTTVLVLIGTLFWVFFQIFPREAILIFGNGDELYLEYAMHFLTTFLFMLPVLGFQGLAANYFSAIGQPLKGVLLSMSRQIFLFIPLCLILPMFMGLEGIAFAAPVSDLIAFVISGAMVIASFHKMKKMEQEAAA